MRPWSHLPDIMTEAHRASAVLNLPGFPHDTGLAASKTGNVLLPNFVCLETSPSALSRDFQEQS
ncbi:uncharacterized protein METZ01_LOCUS442770, partial [marine metagenome]